MIRSMVSCTSVALAIGFFALAPGRAAAQEETPATTDGPAGSTAQMQQDMAAMRKTMEEMSRTLKAIQQSQVKLSRDVAALKAKSPSRAPRQPDTTVYDVNIGNSPVRGPKNAPVTIVEFSDFQCPFCVREWPTIKKVMDAYPEQVRVVFKNFPLSFHKQAKPVAAAAAFAGKSGKFWEMHDLVMANPKKLDPKDLMAHAKSLGLDTAALDEILKDPAKINEMLKDDLAEARKCRVSSTPTVMINGLKLRPRGFANYKKRIDALLAGKGNADAAKNAAIGAGQ